MANSGKTNLIWKDLLPFLEPLLQASRSPTTKIQSLPICSSYFREFTETKGLKEKVHSRCTKLVYFKAFNKQKSAFFAIAFLIFLQFFLRSLLNFALMVSLLTCGWKVDARPRESLPFSKVSSLETLKVIAKPDNGTRIQNAETRAGDKDTSFIAQAAKETSFDGDKQEEGRIAQAREELDQSGINGGIVEDGFENTRFPRNSDDNNPCIKRLDYRIIYNYFFTIPVCKRHKHCRREKKIIRFANGKEFGITSNCVRTWPCSWLSIEYRRNHNDRKLSKLIIVTTKTTRNHIAEEHVHDASACFDWAKWWRDFCLPILDRYNNSIKNISNKAKDITAVTSLHFFIFRN